MNLKFPIDILERSDNYGFYFSVFDASSNQYYSWPENNTKKESDIIPYPSMWGDMISPDKSLPELHFPFLLFSIIIMTVILLQYYNKLKFSPKLRLCQKKALSRLKFLIN